MSFHADESVSFILSAAAATALSSLSGLWKESEMLFSWRVEAADEWMKNRYAGCHEDTHLTHFIPLWTHWSAGLAHTNLLWVWKLQIHKTVMNEENRRPGWALTLPLPPSHPWLSGCALAQVFHPKTPHWLRLWHLSAGSSVTTHYRCHEDRISVLRLPP